MKKIILNIFKNKLYLSALLISILLLLLIIILKNTIFIPLFKKDLLDNTLSEATKVSKHLIRTIDFKTIKNSNFDKDIKEILKEFEINKLHLYSKKGVIIYSTQKEQIGTAIKYNYIKEIVSKGKIYSKISDMKQEDKATSILMEVYIPIFKDNDFIGSFEFYYDITKKIANFQDHVNKANLYMIFFNLIFFNIIFILLYIASKNNLKDIKYQNELESFKHIINETKAYVFTKDLKGCYTFANQLVLDLFKITEKELEGKDDSYFFDLEKSNELKKNDVLVMKKGQSIEKEELNIVKDTGETKIYWSVKRPLYDKNKNIIGMAGISTDITDRKNLEREIKEQQELLNIILDNVDAYIYIKDTSRRFRYVNANTAKLFKKSLENIIGKKETDILPKEMADIFWESDKNVFSKNEKITAEESIIDPNGRVKHYWSAKLPYTLNNEKLLIGFSSDITEIYILKEKLKKEAITDSLTNLYNKRHFEIIAQTEYKRSIRQNIDMSIVIFDIDHFKRINDTYGHFTGDIVLEEASKTFKSLIRDEDTLCRIGGEEFSIILPHTNDKKAFDLAERIRQAIEKQYFESDQKVKISITLSFGVSCLKKDDDKFEDIFLRADKALYEAKNTGRNKTITI